MGASPGHQVAKKSVQPVQDTGAFVDQVVVSLGQRPQMVIWSSDTTGRGVLAEQGGLGDDTLGVRRRLAPPQRSRNATTSACRRKRDVLDGL